MEQYLFPILFFLVLGALVGVLLTIASKLLRVEVDETVEKLNESLPGANCGGCGFSGCDGYANAVAKGEAPTNLCKPGGNDTVRALSAIMGVEAVETEREVAYVCCNGNCEATEDKFTYIGTKSCAAIEKFYNGKGKCQSGCHGMGDCAAVCDNNCISIKNGVAVVDPTNCTACGKCVKICANNLIRLVKVSQKYMVQCSSADTGKVTKASCKNGCIGCGICTKKCPEGAVVINNNHAEIDPSKCTGCGICVAACPIKCIVEIPHCCQ